MNTAILAIGAAFAGFMLGRMVAAMYYLPMLNAAEDERDEAERARDSLCTWDLDEAEIDVRLFGTSSRYKAVK